MTSGILNHVWGVSPAADRVWCKVSGMRPSISAGRFFLVLQAFIDESYSDDVYVLAGCISSAELWAEFSKEWEIMLPKWGRLNKDGKYHFHMQDMNTDELIENVPAFMSTIEKYILGFVSLKLNISDLKSAIKRLSVPGLTLDWAEYEDYEFVGLRCLLDTFHSKRSLLTEIFGDEKIDFYFDENKVKKHIIPIWESHLNSRPDDIRKYYGAIPRFEKDDDFLPLQAADLLAWWFRKCYIDGTSERIQGLEFAGFNPSRKKKLLRIKIEYDQDELVKSLKNTIRCAVGNEHVIYDSGRPLFPKI